MRDRRTLALPGMAALIVAMTARMGWLDGTAPARLAAGALVLTAFAVAAAVVIGIVFVLPTMLLIWLVDRLSAPPAPATSP